MKFREIGQNKFLRQMAKSRIVPIGGVLAAYVVLALAMTWPLARHFGSFVAADAEDGSMSVWTLWWMKFSLLELGQNPLNCQYLFYPDGISVVFHSIPKSLALISIPLQYLVGLTSAYNILFLFTFVGSGVATYFLIYHLTGQKLPAFLGGAFFAFSPYRWGQWNHLALLSTVMIPLYVWALIKAKEALYDGEKRAWLFFAFAGLFLGIQTYDTEHYTISLLLLSGIYLVFNLGLSRSRASIKKWLLLVLGQGMAAIVSALLYLPILMAAYREIAEKGDYVTFPITETQPGVDLLSFVVPTRVSWYLGNSFASAVSHLYSTETVFLGWTILILAIVGVAGFYKNRQVWFWTVAGLVFAALALGRHPVINGETLPIGGPFMLLQKIPIFNSTRVPDRFTVITMLSLSVLAGFGITWLLAPMRRETWARIALPAVAAALLVMLFIEYRPGMIHLTSTTAPKVYEEIAKSDTPGSIVILPLGWEATPSGSGQEKTLFQLYQPVHKRPMVGGMVARAPRESGVKGVYAPVLDFLADPEAFVPSGPDMDAATINEVIEEYSIGFIVIQKKGQDNYSSKAIFTPKPPTIGWTPETLAQLDNYISTFLEMEKFAETSEYIAYRRK